MYYSHYNYSLLNVKLTFREKKNLVVRCKAFKALKRTLLNSMLPCKRTIPGLNPDSVPGLCARARKSAPGRCTCCRPFSTWGRRWGPGPGPRTRTLRTGRSRERRGRGCRTGGCTRYTRNLKRTEHVRRNIRKTVEETLG